MLSLGVLLTSCVSNSVPDKTERTVPSIAQPAGTDVLLDSSNADGAPFSADVPSPFFTAPRHWLIRYAYACSGIGYFSVTFDGTAAGAPVPPLQSQVDDTRTVASGTEYYEVSGRLRIVLHDPCPWHVIVAACSPDCGHEAQPGGVVELSGEASLATRDVDLGPEMMVAYSFDCSTAPGGVPTTRGLSVSIPFSADPTSANTVVTSDRDAGSGVSYFHLLRPRRDQLLVRSNCPWHVRFGPRGAVQPYPDVAPVPLPDLPAVSGKRVLLRFSGDDSLTSDLFSSSGAVVLAYSYQCYGYDYSNLWSVDLQPGDKVSPDAPVSSTILSTKPSASTTVSFPLKGTYSVEVSDSGGACPWQVAVYG